MFSIFITLLASSITLIISFFSFIVFIATISNNENLEWIVLYNWSRRWFGRGLRTDSPETYAGGRTASDLLEFVLDKVSKDTSVGRIESIEELISKMNLEKSSIEKMKETIEGKDDGTDSDDLAIYVKVMKKIESIGYSYIDTESSRLQRMLETGNVPDSKVVTMIKRANVLSFFAELSGGTLSKSEETTDSEL